MASGVPTFVVAGAGRAGTTGLVEGLREHPDVFVTSPKEPHYLALHGSRPEFRGPGDQESINLAAVTDEAAYRALFPTDSRHLALGEGSVSTLYYHQRAVPELLRINPDARVVVLLRDPVARAWSSFQYLRAQGREPESDFLAAVADEPRRRADHWHHLWHYTAMSRYADALETLRQSLRPGHLGVWFHDDLERDYAATFAEVLGFLGLPLLAGLGDDVPRVNASGTPRYRRLQEAMWRAQGQEALRRAGRMLTTWRFREAVKTRMLRRDAVPDEVRRALAPTFAEDLARLALVLPAQTGRPDWLAAPRGSRVP
ncbi:sulfotransferase family protein [Nocardioides sp. GXQ0305]|uniref:sulfotransferase family protein n=1 Tax=Nocardioides sp. GXQ0305 TaxID=3423912 RepID=UPI003D7DE871